MKNFPSIHNKTDPKNPSPACGRRILGLQLWLLCGAALLAFSSGAHANDAAFSGVGGTPKLMKGEHSSIAMQSEKIVIVANDQTYETTVDFIFRNDGGATSVQMGFPEISTNSGEPTKKVAFLRFATWVDGRKVAARRIVTSPNLNQGTTEAYWLKTVSFGARQRRRIRVSYTSPMGAEPTWGTHRVLNYAFTGQNWKGKVERSDLEIHIQQPGLWIGLPVWNYEPFAINPEIGAKEAVFRKTWRNWQAQGDFKFGLTRAVPFWMWDRYGLQNSIASYKRRFALAKTFRVGAVPTELPPNTESPPAFARNGVIYISLSHLTKRLGDFAADLREHRQVDPTVALQWNAKTGVSTLVAGSKTLEFKPGKSHNGAAAPVLLRGYSDETGEYYPRLYIPLAPVAKTLGLNFKHDPKNRLFDLSRGTWTGQ